MKLGSFVLDQKGEDCRGVFVCGGGIDFAEGELKGLCLEVTLFLEIGALRWMILSLLLA
jgi:hypothetical protein